MIDLLIRRLEERQAELARDALGKPADRTEFEYGRACGFYAGLEDAKNLIFNIQADKDAHDNTL